ncbi:MAG: PAS domain-containing protein [Mariprofundaceae bacterium]|nr:PAS domain-containing protein [Mariprofundaceae bacterium]
MGSGGEVVMRLINRRAVSRQPWLVYLLAASMAILLFMVVMLISRVGWHMSEHHVPLVNAAHEISIRTALFYLRLEEVLNGDKSVDVATIQAHLDRALWYAAAMLHGGETADGVIIPLQDAALLEQVNQTLAALQGLGAMAQQRLDRSQSSGTVSDRYFDAEFDRMMQLSKGIELLLYKAFSREISRFQYLAFALTFLMLVVAILMLFMLYRYERARRESVEALALNKERLAFLLNTTPAVIYSCHYSGEFIPNFVSANLKQMTGYAPEEWIGDADFWCSHIHPDDRPRVLADLGTLFSDGQYHHEYRFRHNDGSYIWIYDALRMIRDADGEPQEIVGYWMDISQRKAAEDNIAAALAEKEVLLHELNHRVKNNLQVLSSLMHMQAENIAGKSETAIRAGLDDSCQRIRAMALVHELIYRQEALHSIHFQDYIRTLAMRLVDAHAGGGSGIAITVKGEGFSLNLEQAVPCGLIANELITNCLKHAFPSAAGEIIITLNVAADERAVMVIADNGVGMPDAIAWQNPASMGLELVHLLCGQLHAEIERENWHGTCYTMIFVRREL